MISNKNWAIPSILLSMFSVQGGASIAKQLFPILGPAGTNSLRLGFAGVLLCIVNRPNILKFKKNEWLYSLIYGFCIGFMNLFFYLGIQRIPLGIGVTIEFIGPLGLAIITSRKLVDFLWIILAGIGIFLIIPKADVGSDLFGYLFVFLAGLLWAGYIVIGGKVAKKMKASDAVTVGMCFATLIVLPLALYNHNFISLNFGLLLIGLCVGIFSSALPFSLDIIALRKLPAKTFSILQSFQPVFGAFLGTLFLKEMLSIQQWIAILCVITASVGSTLFSGENKNKKLV